MDFDAFDTLLDLIRHDLTVNEEMAARRGGAITPEMCLYSTLRYLAGGTAIDISNFVGFSVSHCYKVIEKTLMAIVKCKALDFHFPRTDVECASLAFDFKHVCNGGAIKNCVGAVGGYLLSINTPRKRDAANVKGFFSGHYQRYGINVQACCDCDCRFTYFSLSAPGSRNDRVAVRAEDENGVSLHKLIEALPAHYVVIGDAAYKPSEKLIALYYGASKNEPLYDNFNYHASQCRIRIEMSFGLMTQKWRILLQPLLHEFWMIKLITQAIARLHNFCINWRKKASAWNPAARCVALGIDAEAYNIENEANDGFILPEHQSIRTQEIVGGSQMRRLMAERVRRRNLERPRHSKLHRSNR
jgi:DDE superfamily endonuclease